jgi:hypothetical protein
VLDDGEEDDGPDDDEDWDQRVQVRAPPGGGNQMRVGGRLHVFVGVAALLRWAPVWLVH